MEGERATEQMKRGLLSIFSLLGPLGLSPPGDLRKQHKLFPSKSSCLRNEVDGWFFTPIIS